VKVEAAKAQDFRWLQARTSCALTTDFTALKAVDSAGRIRGMVGFCNNTESATQAHMAVDAPIVWRSLLPAAMHYVFEQCRKDILLGAIPSGNARSIRLAQSAGLREVHRVRDGWAKGEDLVLLELRREECRFLSKERMVA
jgi:hypothetical protein